MIKTITITLFISFVLFSTILLNAQNKIIDLESIQIRPLTEKEKNEIGSYIPNGFYVVKSNNSKIKVGDFLIKIDGHEVKSENEINQAISDARKFGTVEIDLSRLTTQGLVKKVDYKAMLSFKSSLSVLWEQRTEFLSIDGEIFGIYNINNNTLLFTSQGSLFFIYEITPNDEINSYNIKKILGTKGFYGKENNHFNRLYFPSNNMMLFVSLYSFYGEYIDHALFVNLTDHTSKIMELKGQKFNSVGSVTEYEGDKIFGNLLFKDRNKKLYDPTGKLIANPPYNWKEFPSINQKNKMFNLKPRLGGKSILFISPITNKAFHLKTQLNDGQLYLNMEFSSGNDSEGINSNVIPPIAYGKYSIDYFDINQDGQIEWIVKDRNKLYIIPTSISIKK